VSPTSSTRPSRTFAHLLVAGGAGFVGSAYVRDVLGRRDGTVVTVLDKLTYAGNRANLEPAFGDPEQAGRLSLVVGDIADPETVAPLARKADAVINFAAESHVDRSILDSEAFLRTGVLGVRVLLEAVRAEATRAAAAARSVPRFLQVSTDEVYGSIEAGTASETAILAPSSPYAAAKAAGDLLAASYSVTFGLDIVVTRGSNTYGPFQHPEKFIPLFLTNAIDDLPLPLYGDGLHRRDWLFVTDHAGAIDHVLRHGASGEVYNISGSRELTNRDMTQRLLHAIGKPESLIRNVADRQGHDRRYAMDDTKLRALGWRNRVDVEVGLEQTVAWFRDNEPWWRATRSGDWNAYYDRQYGERLGLEEPV
jgi:dTDP-glucose 4,6-dehydratase